MNIDIEHSQSLAVYLREAGLVAPEDRLVCTKLTGGVSNRAVLVTVNGADRWVVKQALEKLRVPVDWFSSPERIHREAAGLRALAAVLTERVTPGFVHEDKDTHILIMEAIPQPHTNWKQMLMAGELDPAHVRQFAEMLASIHSRALTQRETVAAQFADRHFFETLRVEPYYRYSAQQVPESTRFIEDLIDSTWHNTHTLVHGDYSPKNILVHDDRLVLLDHEVIHWGDPAFDIGFSMTHLLSKAHHLATLRAAYKEAALEYWRTYAASIEPTFGTTFEARCVQHTLGCLLARVAGRSQLEYLNAAEKSAQRSAVVRLMQDTSATMPDLIEGFIEEIHDTRSD